MTDPNYTHIALIVDRSGSMVDIRDAAEQGVKSLISEQRAMPGRLTIGMFEFDDQFDEVDDVDGWTLIPRGMTALLDAIGKAVTITGERLAVMPEHERPGHVLVGITTDGYENSSKEWTRRAVFDLVTQQRKAYGWEFAFTAANQDAIATATALGVPAVAAASFAATASGARGAYAATSNAFTGVRSGAAPAVTYQTSTANPAPTPMKRKRR
jgi:hypothetical protein